MRVLLREFAVLVAQLESQQRKGQLSMQKLWFYVQPAMRSLGTLHRIVGELGHEDADSKVSDAQHGSVGAALLNSLLKLSHSGDQSCRTVCQFY